MKTLKKLEKLKEELHEAKWQLLVVKSEEDREVLIKKGNKIIEEIAKLEKKA